jgi:hypothetical protein
MAEEKGLSFLNRPICQNLRTKALYIAGGNLQNLVETNPDSHYWCNCTMMVVGPDDRFVSPDDCKAARSCFEPIGGTPVV